MKKKDWGEEFEEKFGNHRDGSEEYGSYIGYISYPQIKQFIKQLLKERDKEVIERIAGIPRIVITHKDGSQSKAILEHSLETHGLIKSN